MNDLLNQALDRWGHDAQVVMAIEEMGELTVELAKHLNGRGDNMSAVWEEIADVAIMVEQLKLIFGPTVIEGHVRRKLDRLQDRLDV